MKNTVKQVELVAKRMAMDLVFNDYPTDPTDGVPYDVFMSEIRTDIESTDAGFELSEEYVFDTVCDIKSILEIKFTSFMDFYFAIKCMDKQEENFGDIK